MNADRLLTLAAFLETVPPGDFAMHTWAGEVMGECKFSGCAIGWAVHGKLFRGLRFDKCDTDVRTEWEPVYRDLRGMNAVQKLFEIDCDAADALFGCGRVGRPTDVAQRIRKFVCDRAKSAHPTNPN